MYRKEYEKKRTTPEEAVRAIESGHTVVHGMAAAEPPGLLKALADRARAGGLGEIDVYSLYPFPTSRETILAPDLCDCVNSYTWFVSAQDRGLVKTGLSLFIPNEFHQVPRFIQEAMSVDAVITTVSPMDKNGFFTFGAVNDFISTAARCARRVIVEVNEHMPRVFGDSLIHVSEVDAIIENHAPLMEAAPAVPKPGAEKIAELVAALVPDGATIQIGVGAIPNVVCSRLKDRKDLGIHSELMCPGLMDLVVCGAANGRKKNLHAGKHLFTNALGDRALYDFIHDNPSCESYPVSYINDPAVIARHENFISINSTIEVDLLGQCNSEYLFGSQFSGTGGELDFVRGAYRSRGGKSIIAFHATAKDGAVSRVVPRLAEGAVVTVPRTDTHMLATEHGLVNLKGRSTRDRALAVISLADPRFRDELTREADNMRLL